MDKKTVLIVDDEPTVCDTMKDIIEPKGYRVLIAHNGVNGLKICAEEKVHLIVLDLMMPRMDGYMFMERLTERWEHENRSFDLPRVLVMSAVDAQSDMGLAKNLGANEYMNKPFQGKEFLAAIERLLG